jgi:hypothetical protein
MLFLPHKLLVLVTAFPHKKTTNLRLFLPTTLALLSHKLLLLVTNCFSQQEDNNPFLFWPPFLGLSEISSQKFGILPKILLPSYSPKLGGR